MLVRPPPYIPHAQLELLSLTSSSYFLTYIPSRASACLHVPVKSGVCIGVHDHLSCGIAAEHWHLADCVCLCKEKEDCMHCSQAYPLVTTFLGIFLFKEFHEATRRTQMLVAAQFSFYLAAIVLVACSAEVRIAHR